MGGDATGTLEILLSSSTSSLTSITCTTKSDSFAVRYQMMGPYEEIVVPVLAHAPPANTFTPDALAAALQSNCDRREGEQLETGQAKMSSLFIDGVMDIKTGNITTLALPRLTIGHDECCAKTTKEDKDTAMKRMLDLNNKSRPAGNSIVTYCDMEHHDKNM